MKPSPLSISVGLILPVGKGLHRAVVTRPIEDSIGQRVFAAVQSPGRADRPLDMGVDGRRPAHAHFVGHAQAAAKLARAAGVLAQRAVLDDDGIFRFGGFHRRIMGVAVVEAHRRVHAVFIMLGAPAAAGMADMRPEKAPGLGVEAMRD